MLCLSYLSYDSDYYTYKLPTAYSTIGTGPGVISNESLHENRSNLSPTHQSVYNNRRPIYSTRNNNNPGSMFNGFRNQGLMTNQKMRKPTDEVQLRPVRKFPVQQRPNSPMNANHIRTSDNSDVIAQKLANVKIKQVHY